MDLGQSNTLACGCGQCARNRAVDIHAHYYSRSYLAAVGRYGVDAGAQFVEVHGRPALKVGALFTGPIAERFIDLDLRLADMDGTGVHQQVLSLTQPMVYWAPENLADRLSQVFNDSIVEANEKAKDRLFGFGTLPMQFPDRAIHEARRIAKLPGMKGVYLGTAINDLNLSDPMFWPVYEVLEDLDLPIFLHPLKVVAMQDRMSQYFLFNLLGNPFDTAIAAAHLIFSGVMDKFPRLEVSLPHGGGALPFLLGRIAHGWANRPECSHLERSPYEYASRFFYDTITHDPRALSFLIDQVGSGRIMLGSDYCFDMGVERPRAQVESLESLSEIQKTQILGGNAQKLLNLS